MADIALQVMRRLIAFLPLILLASCTPGDIALTSDVGEKTIVKRATISPAKDNSINVSKNIELIREYKSSSIWNRNDYVAALEYENEHKDELGIWKQKFTYKTIFIDINGIKKVNHQRFVRCVDPNLSDSAKETLSGYYPFASPTYADNNLVGTRISRQICSEYAKW